MAGIQDPIAIINLWLRTQAWWLISVSNETSENGLSGHLFGFSLNLLSGWKIDTDKINK